jgi:hypothetical protein
MKGWPILFLIASICFGLVGFAELGKPVVARHEVARFFLLSLIAMLFVTLTACGPATGSDASNAVDRSLPATAYMKLWTDPDTGCRYYIYREGAGTYAVGGISARLRADGSADCPAHVGKSSSPRRWEPTNRLSRIR